MVSGTVGIALAGLPLFLAGAVGEGVFGWSAALTSSALAGISESGVAGGLALVAVRPAVRVELRGGRWMLVVLVSAIAMPVVVGAGLASYPGLPVTVVLLVGIVRTVIGIYLAVHTMFVGGLVLGRPWSQWPQSGIVFGLVLIVFLVFVIPTLSLDSIPLLGLLGVWLAVLVALAGVAFRFYEIDRDLSAPRLWARLAGAAGVIGLVLSAAMVYQVGNVFGL
jgi:hypothetical protein